MKKLIPVVALAVALAAVGCGGGTTDVSGTVTYKGKPVVFGTVVLVGPDGVPKNGAIRPDGSFTVNGVMPGTVKVAVTSPPPPGATAPKAAPKGGRDAGDNRTPADAGEVNPDVAKNWFPLPESLGYPDKSGVTVEVAAGKPVTVELK